MDSQNYSVQKIGKEKKEQRTDETNRKLWQNGRFKFNPIGNYIKYI